MITDKLEALGSWRLTLDPGCPLEVLERLDFFGHLAVWPGQVQEVAARGDELLNAARYVGVLRRRRLGDEEQPSIDLSGVGLAVWLGDEDGKGAVIQSVYSPSGLAPNVVAATLITFGQLQITLGTIHVQPGTHTATYNYNTVREILDYMAPLYDCHWRINNDWSFDFGTDAELFVTDPQAVVVRRRALAGRESTRRAALGRLGFEEDVEDWTSRVLLLDGALSSTGNAETASGSIAYHGPQQVMRWWIRTVNESETSTGNATARAQLHLNRFSGTRRNLQLSTADFEVVGDVRPGDYVYVYDPDSGLTDDANPIDHRGHLIHPAKIQCVGISWPVTDGHTVGFRRSDGTGDWIDLTPWVRWETGDVELEVGTPRKALTKAKPGPEQWP